MRTSRINFLDVSFDQLTLDDVANRLGAARPETAYAYVVTPNVDHVVRIHREHNLRHLYEAADICVCDSRVLRFLARLSGIRLPLVAGSDLTSKLFGDLLKPGDRVGVIGGSAASVERLRSMFSEIDFHHHQPPMNLRHDPSARRDAAAFIASSNARFTFVAVGSPQQEMIAREARDHAGAGGIAMCIGAGLEFLTGEQRRAPKSMQKLGLEWAHRLATNPRRLWRRYLVEGVAIFPIYLSWRKRSPARTMTMILAGASALAVAGIYAAHSYSRAPFVHSSDTRLLPPATPAGSISLPPPNLLKPLSPQEATMENAERPFVNRPDSAASRFVLKTDEQDRDRALTCLTQAVYYEAASEGVDGGRAVAQVVLNRMRHPGYPASVCGVVYQGADRPAGCQFTFTCDGSLLRAPVASLWTRSRMIAEDALAGKVFAPIGHATHYHADYVLPYWADSLDKTVQIGRHIFYRLRSSLGDSRSFFQRYAGAEPSLPSPDSKAMIPPGEATQALANALLSDRTAGSIREVEKASALGTTQLSADSLHGALLADAGGPPAPAKKTKAATECAAQADRKKLAPLGANDMHASVGIPGC
jgi:exopolysaccharide biosynthesis WecB/TagA/CpsF family protein